jgi:hypothetical protein
LSGSHFSIRTHNREGKKKQKGDKKMNQITAKFLQEEWERDCAVLDIILKNLEKKPEKSYSHIRADHTTPHLQPPHVCAFVNCDLISGPFRTCPRPGSIRGKLPFISNPASPDSGPPDATPTPADHPSNGYSTTPPHAGHHQPARMISAHPNPETSTATPIQLPPR